MAPVIPLAGSSSVSSFDEKAQVDSLSLGDLIILHALDLISRYSLLVPVRSQNPEEIWDTSCASLVAVFGKPRIMRMDEGGEWKNDLWVDLRADRHIKLQHQGVGAHTPWISERRDGLVRGIYNRMHAEGRYAGRRLISEVQFCLNTMPSTNGFSACHLVFGSNPADNFGWGDEDEDLLFAQDASLPEQFVAKWKLCMMAQEAALKEIAQEH